MANCKQCGDVLEVVAGKEPKIYCSDACRKTYNRQHRTPPTPDETTPDTPIKLTPDTMQQTPERQVYKRGKDIKSFEDLPLDVQADIELMSVDKANGDDAVYEQEHKDRTERAIRYQHLFPDRFYSGSREVAGPLLNDFELCRYCGQPLPVLENRRQGPGACLVCVMSKYGQPNYEGVCKAFANQRQTHELIGAQV